MTSTTNYLDMAGYCRVGWHLYRYLLSNVDSNHDFSYANYDVGEKYIATVNLGY